jgi:hypothetical protein
MNELSKLAASTGELRKRASDLEAQILDVARRLAKLESREDWPAFHGATFLALGVANLRQAPRALQ